MYGQALGVFKKNGPEGPFLDYSEAEDWQVNLYAALFPV